MTGPFCTTCFVVIKQIQLLSKPIYYGPFFFFLLGTRSISGKKVNCDCRAINVGQLLNAKSAFV